MSIDFSLKDFFHPIEILRLHRTLDRSQWLPGDELRALQENLLRDVLAHAFEKVPYYRNLARTLGLGNLAASPLDTLDRMPILRKSAVRDFSDRLVADNVDQFGPHRYSTSGTSGQPLHFLLDRRANALEFVYYWRYWSWGGYRLGDRFAELSTHYFLKRPALGDRSNHYQPHLRRLVLNSGQISSRVALEMAQAIRHHKPLFLKGIASALYCLALSLREANCSDIGFRCVFSTGELLTDQYRNVISGTFGCPVLDSYGHMERTVAISQCPQGSYHVHSDYGLLQFESVRSNEQGQVFGRAVGTSLYNMAMPFIKYDIGDEIEVFPEIVACPCGRTLPTIKRLRGRHLDVIRTPDGRFITTIFILPELVPGIRLAQFIQTGPSKLEVNVLPKEDWTSESEAELKSSIERLLGPSIEVRIRQARLGDFVRDPSGKLPPVITWENWKTRGLDPV